MNAQTAILTRLATDAELVTLLTSLPGDTRLTPFSLEPFTPEATPAAFMRTDLNVLWPSAYISAGGPVLPHPQQNRITYLAAMYPQVWFYVPALAGIDYRGILRQALDLARRDLEEYPLIDPDTGIPGRLSWQGDLQALEAEEYDSTWTAASTWQYRTRWRLEEDEHNG